MTTRIPSRWSIILFAAGTFLLLSLGLLLLITSRLSQLPKPGTFCTVDDRAYQALQSNYSKWIDYFVATYPLDSREVLLRDENGKREYLVRSYYDNEFSSDGKPLLFMPTRFPPNDIYGAEGYVYTPNNRVPEFSRYEFSQLAENFYCYRLK